jgi:hypothetical protein
MAFGIYRSYTTVPTRGAAIASRIRRKRYWRRRRYRRRGRRSGAAYYGRNRPGGPFRMSKKRQLAQLGWDLGIPAFGTGLSTLATAGLHYLNKRYRTNNYPQIGYV